jgi:hypothetical protein
MSGWYYEYDGKKHGPVPSETLRHLASHQAITTDTTVWKEGMAEGVPASRVKGLFAQNQSTSADPNAEVKKMLDVALEACRNDAEASLSNHNPPMGVISPWSVSDVLLDFEVTDVQQLPTPVDDPSVPASKKTKPVRLIWRAVVKVVLCDRPRQAMPVAELRRLQPGRRESEAVLIAKQFADGDWIFMDASLEG